jgi:integrase
MQAQQSNVSKLYTNNTVFAHIQSFLRSKGLKSKNTQTTYEADIRQFFSYMRDKPIEELSSSDLLFVNSDILDYQIYLSEDYRDEHGNPYKNTTVNRKMASLQSLYAFLKRNEYPVNVEAMKVDPLPDDSNGYGFLTFDEAEQLAQLALTEREMGKEKRALILLATRTSLRKNALLSLKYSDIRQSEYDSNVYIIEVQDMKQRSDKGKKIVKEISAKMYNILLEIKNEKYNDDLIFHIDPKYVNDMMNRLTKKLGIDPRRNVTFHSLKKAGVGFVKDLTNDIEAASDQAGHSSILTTKKYYLEEKKNVAGLAMDENIPADIFRQLSHTECIELLESIENGLGLQLKRKAQSIIQNRRV